MVARTVVYNYNKTPAQAFTLAFNRRWYIRVEQLVEQCELHLYMIWLQMSMSP